jgi:ubiquinone/menaquinone biosynthesis C-methylase UbiE
VYLPFEMANPYKKFILPRLLNKEMGSDDFEKIRPGIVGAAEGITLEIGIGPGYNIPHYKNISKLIALDPSKELLDIARARAGSLHLSFPVDFLCASAEHIPLPDKSVDTVVSTWTLCSVGNLRQTLKELARVLRPNGRFIFSDHGAAPVPRVRFVQKLITPFTRHFTGNCHLDREIDKDILEAGFVLQKIERSAEPLRPLIYNYEGVAVHATSDSVR